METKKNKTELTTENGALIQSCVSVSAFLSGKCEQDFKEFYTENGKYKFDFKEYVKVIQSSIIIEWFDKLEFYINIEVIKDKTLGYVRGFDADVTFHFHGDLMTVNADCLKEDIYNTRTEAILKAIQKASEVYNTKYVDSN